MKHLTIFDYAKLIALNVIVALVIAFACIGFVYADGVDDPNFYNDFNPNSGIVNPKYNKIAPPEYNKAQEYNVEPIPSGSDYWKRVRNIPEPTELILLSVGAASMCAWRRYK